MPLSKKKDRDRKRLFRLDRQLSPPAGANHVQPKLPIKEGLPTGVSYIDADGSMVYNC